MLRHHLWSHHAHDNNKKNLWMNRIIRIHCLEIYIYFQVHGLDISVINKVMERSAIKAAIHPFKWFTSAQTTNGIVTIFFNEEMKSYETNSGIHVHSWWFNLSGKMKRKTRGKETTSDPSLIVGWLILQTWIRWVWSYTEESFQLKKALSRGMSVRLACEVFERISLCIIYFHWNVETAFVSSALIVLLKNTHLLVLL